jgi:hypothetical protein
VILTLRAGNFDAASLTVGSLFFSVRALLNRKERIVPRSILEAIRLGQWDFEPPERDFGEFDATDAMPGTREKLHAMAERIRLGMPLWHVADRDDVEDPPPLRNRPR